MKLTVEQIQILSEGVIEDNRFYLQGQLDRKQYLNINEVLNTLGLIWNKGKKAHIADLSNEELKEALDDIIATGEVETLKETIKKFQFYSTPDTLSYKMIDLLDIQEDDRILEPSAGLGNIVKCILNKYPARLYKLYVNELDSKKVEELAKIDGITGEVMNKDFLDFIGVMKYDKIIANPPFSKSQDVKHILHMYELLNEGGRIVSIASNGIKFREGKLYDELRALNPQIIELPEGSFRESGTLVNSVIVIIDK